LGQHNDNNGNTYSDVYWLASVIESIGSLEFGQQVLIFAFSLLKLRNLSLILQEQAKFKVNLLEAVLAILLS
jgi:hypothetical protein